MHGLSRAGAKMNTVDVQTLNVPVRSCGGAEGCHVTATSDEGGILNYEIDQKKKEPEFCLHQVSHNFWQAKRAGKSR